MIRHIEFDRLHNFRDLGGYRGDAGRTVRWGSLYRSDSLGKLRPGSADWERFSGLGVRTVIDLRYPFEIESRGRVPAVDGLVYHNLSIEHRPYDQAAINPDVDPWRYLADRYAEVLDDGAKELRTVLEVIAAEDSSPLVFHCASGKDRTGIVAALVLSLLGVAEAEVLTDFALTELATERLLADWQANHLERASTWPSFGRAPAEIMRLTLGELAERYGSVQGYAAERLGLEPELTEALRRRLLTSE